MNPILLRATLATVIAIAGGILGAAGGRYAVRRLPVLVYTALGALLAVTLFDILPDAKSLLPWGEFTAALFSGFLLFLLVSRYIFQICPACSISVSDTAPNPEFLKIAPLIVIALAIHSTMDGLAIAVGDEIARQPNWAVLIAISLHKLPEGLALALLLMGGGISPRYALLWTAGIEMTTELGGLLGVYGSRRFSLPVLGMIFAHVGGGFLYLIASTFQSFAHGRSRLPARPLIFGGGIMFMMTSFLLWTIRLYAH